MAHSTELGMAHHARQDDDIIGKRPAVAAAVMWALVQHLASAADAPAAAAALELVTALAPPPVSFVGDAKSSLGDAKSSLGDATSSLGGR